MSGRRFLQWSLTLPLVAPVFFLPFHNAVGELLFIAIGMGIWEYVPFGLVMYWLLGRAGTYGRAHVLMVVAPVMYVAIVAAAWGGWFFARHAFGLDATELELLPIVCMFAIVIGYGYVMVVAALLALGHTLGWVRTYEAQFP